MFKIEKSKNAIISICFLVSVSVIYYINTQVLLYSDDYFYGTFFKNGIQNFIELTVWHYENSNGRVFVHIVAQLVLIFDTLLFPIVNIIFLLSICYFSYKLQNKEFNKIYFIIYIAFFFSAIMLLDVKLLRESLLWISASFNYTFPAMLLFAIFYCQKQYVFTNKFKWYAIILSFVCGATTEQYGAAAIFGICVISIFCRVKEKFKFIYFKILLLYLVPCIVGWLTIIISPATSGRLERENSGLFNLSALFERFEKLSDIMSNNGSTVLFIMFGIFMGFTFFYDIRIQSKKMPLFICGVYILISVVLFFLNNDYINIISLCLNLSFLIFIIIILLRREDYIFTAIILLAALILLFIMLLTDSVTFRTTFPFILFLMAACSNLAVKFFKSYKIVLPVYVIICCIVFFPVVRGYHYNKTIMNDNIKIINNLKGYDNEIIELNTNFDDLYRHKMMHDEAYTYIQFQKYYNIENAIIYIKSDKLPPYTKSKLRVDGEYMEFEIYSIMGSNYFKIDDIAYALRNTEKQFNIIWDYNNYTGIIKVGEPYAIKHIKEKESGIDEVDDTVYSLARSKYEIYLAGAKIDLMAYEISGGNYFKLRDIAEALDFGVRWNSVSNTIIIETNKNYTPN